MSSSALTCCCSALWPVSLSYDVGVAHMVTFRVNSINVLLETGFRKARHCSFWLRFSQSHAHVLIRGSTVPRDTCSIPWCVIVPCAGACLGCASVPESTLCLSSFLSVHLSNRAVTGLP